MKKMNLWLTTRFERSVPSLMAAGLLVLSIVLAACGRGGGSGY